MQVKTEFPRALQEIENLFITLKDGTRLAARIWHPAGDIRESYDFILVSVLPTSQSTEQKMSKTWKKAVPPDFERNAPDRNCSNQVTLLILPIRPVELIRPLRANLKT